MCTSLYQVRGIMSVFGLHFCMLTTPERAFSRLGMNYSLLLKIKRLHLDIVSAYLHATLTGPPRYITLWGDEEEYVRQLFKAMNGADSAAQVWNKHFHAFMERVSCVLPGMRAFMYIPLLWFKVRCMLTIFWP